MDLSFEAGLPKAWDIFMFERYEISHLKNEDEDMLNFVLIAPYILVMVIGYSVALLVLTIEIFYRDFLLNFSKIFFWRKIRWKSRKFKHKSKQSKRKT